MDRGMVEFYWSLGAEIKIQSILRGAVPVCSSDRGPRSQLMEVRTVVFTHESQLHPWPLSMFLSVQGDTVNCCDRLPIDEIIELDIRLGENDCIYIYTSCQSPLREIHFLTEMLTRIYLDIYPDM
jgi:hypothetical protein